MHIYSTTAPHPQNTTALRLLSKFLLFTTLLCHCFHYLPRLLDAQQEQLAACQGQLQAATNDKVRLEALASEKQGELEEKIRSRLQMAADLETANARIAQLEQLQGYIHKASSYCFFVHSLYSKIINFCEGTFFIY